MRFFIGVTYALGMFILLASCKRGAIDDRWIRLDKGWKLKLGDDVGWAQPGIDERGWDSVPIGTRYGLPIFDTYDGYGWYRVSVLIPDSMKKGLSDKDSLKIYLGKIDDCDEVFLNGTLVGENTRTLPATAHPDTSFKHVGGLWNAERKYVLSIMDKRIFWGKPNLIAIRVFDGGQAGGQYGSMPAIGIKSLSDRISADFGRFFVVDSAYRVDNHILVKNSSTAAIENLTLLITAKDTVSKMEDYRYQSVLSLSPGELKAIPVALPVSTDPTEVSFNLADDRSHTAMHLKYTVPYVLTLTQ